MNTKSVSFLMVGLILVAGVSVSYLISRPAIFGQQVKAPVFMGEEVIVQKAAVAVKAFEGNKAVRVERAISKIEPKPVVQTPLPIVPPRVMSRVLPTYPQAALEQGLAGTALLSVYVGLTGNAEKVQLKSSSGVSALDQSAIAAVSQWTFAAARHGGAAMASWFEIPVRFEVK